MPTAKTVLVPIQTAWFQSKTKHTKGVALVNHCHDQCCWETKEVVFVGEHKSPDPEFSPDGGAQIRSTFLTDSLLH